MKKEIKRVIITRKIPKIAKELLLKNGFKVTVSPDPLGIPQDKLVQKVKNYDAILSMMTNKFTQEVIDQLKNVKIIANYAVGYDNFDAEYAKSKNIVMTNTPDILTESTADLAFALVLAASRNLSAGDKMVREGRFIGWSPQMLLGPELMGKTFAIIGAGRIGQATARRAKAFGCKIVYYSKSKKPEFEKELDAKKVSLNKLISTADIISLHVPLTPESQNILNKENMKNLKKGVVIVNTARGGVLDEIELIKLLKNKTVFAAGLDVYENEPNVKKEFMKLENVVLLPHLGSSTFEARNAMAELAAKNIVNVLKGEKPITPVN